MSRGPRRVRGRGRAAPQDDGRAAARLKQPRGSPHPWVWKSMVAVPPDAPPGAVVVVEDPEGTPIGRAFWNPRARIALRLLTTDPQEEIDAAFFRRRLERCAELRRPLRLEETTDSWRLCHSEADGLSGLVVDVLGAVVLAEVFALGMANKEDDLRAALAGMFPDKRVVLRSDKRSGGIEGFELFAREDDPAGTRVREGPVRYEVDLRTGHKTGFFLDQRENRAFLAGFTPGKRVLDGCCYTGGFALNAALAGAAQVTGVDLDEKAIAVAQRNAKLNQTRVKLLQADAFHYLRQIAEQPEPPEVIVLDPPKLAADREEVGSALRSYVDLNRLALQAIADEGLLLTCSCSGSVSEEAFLDALRSAAAQAKKQVIVLRVSGAAADHPVALHVPESRYLKAVFARVRQI